VKIDGRKLSHAQLEPICFQAVKAVQAGQPPTAVARALGLYPARVFVWLAAYRAGGWDALRARKASGRPKRLTVDGVPVEMDLQYRDIEKIRFSCNIARALIRAPRDLHRAVNSRLRLLQKNPDKVRAFFQMEMTRMQPHSSQHVNGAI
jgi:transposase